MSSEYRKGFNLGMSYASLQRDLKPRNWREGLSNEGIRGFLDGEDFRNLNALFHDVPVFDAKTGKCIPDNSTINWLMWRENDTDSD